MPGDISLNLNDLRRGNLAATARLDQLLRAQLLGYVRYRRSSSLRNKIDSEGVVNSVLKSVFTGLAEDAFPEVIDSKTLKDLLFNLVRCALRSQWRYWTAQKRDAGREESHESGAPDDVQQPTFTRPEYVAEINECLERLYKTVSALGENAVDVWHGMLNGLTRKEIAEQTQLTAGQVGHLTRRIQNECRPVLQKQLGEDIQLE